MSLTVTTIDELKAIAQGKVIELPGWEDDKPFYARLQRPSLQIMVANGEIPNSLLGAATKVFYGTSKGDKDINMSEMVKVQMSIVKASLVEPTVEDLEGIGLKLTDEQMLAIFQYSQMGLKGLEQFRAELSNPKNNKPIKDVQGKAE